MRHICLLILLSLFISNCTTSYQIVYPVAETEPVKSKDDAADDSCLYIHFNDPNKSAIIGTDKQKGLVIYDFEGKIIREYSIGRVNNVDIRQAVRWNGEEITIVGGSNRTDNSLVFYQLNEDNHELSSLTAAPIKSKVDEVYGFCMYQNKRNVYAFVVGKDGVVEQWLLSPNSNSKISAKMVRTFDVGEQCEGMVTDDEFGKLYIGEEEVGIWKYGAEPDDGDKRVKVQLISENKALKSDIEGLTIYYKSGGEGYLIASSQGNNSYAVYARSGQNKYLGSFKIKSSDSIDGTSDTDGIDVTAAAIGSKFPKGAFVAQDGKNTGGLQNFKIIDWRSIEKYMIQ